MCSSPPQIESEIQATLDLTEELLTTFGFRGFEINLSTRPEKAVGSDEIWEKAEAALRNALAAKVRSGSGHGGIRGTRAPMYAYASSRGWARLDPPIGNPMTARPWCRMSCDDTAVALATMTPLSSDVL